MAAKLGSTTFCTLQTPLQSPAKNMAHPIYCRRLYVPVHLTSTYVVLVRWYGLVAYLGDLMSQVT